MAFLDAGVCRGDWVDNPELSQGQLDALNALTDAQIEAALETCTDDAFWAALDSVRTDATALLMAQNGIADENVGWTS